MSRQHFALIAGVLIVLFGISVSLYFRSQGNPFEQTPTPDPKKFHRASWLPPTESGDKRILKVESPGKIFRIPEDLVLMGPVPTSIFTMKMIWPEWIPLRLSGRYATIKDVIRVHVRLDPNKRQRTGRDLLSWQVEHGSYLSPVQLKEYPELLVYSHPGTISTAYYESNRPDGVTPEGDPILFHCVKGRGREGGDFTPCRGDYRIFGDILVTVAFYGERINDGTDIFLKSMELIRSLVEVKS